MRYFLLFSILFFFGLGLSSCNKMLDIPTKRAVASENMWQTKNDAWAGSAACYALIRAALANENAYWVYGDLRGHDFSVTRRGDLKAVVDNQLTSNYSTMDSWRDWRRFYAAIDQCNIAIENLPKVPERDYRYSTQEMKLDLAQVRALRAFLYFYIVRIWGDVPFLTRPADGSFRNVKRTDWHKVLDFAAKEAAAAFKDLPWRYDGDFPESPGDYRGQTIAHHRSIAVTKGMTLTLRAHIYAWQHKYVQAAEICDEIINNQDNTQYDFTSAEDLTRLDGTFRGRRDENIFQIDFNITHAEYSTTGQLEDWTLRAPHIPKKESEIYVSKDSIISIFNEKNDSRKDLYFAHMDDEHPEFYKLKQLNGLVKDPPIRFYTSAIVLFRYEELYLLRAECRAQLGRISEAVNDLNALREERGIDLLKGSMSKEEVLHHILQGRRRELMGEGWRWFDLVRLGKVAAYTNLTEEDVQQGAIYWPLSKAALQQNTLLVQNKFWR